MADIDVGAKCWHARVEVTPHVQSQLAMEADCGGERERVDAFSENDVRPVGSDRDEAVVGEKKWGVVAGVAWRCWVPGVGRGVHEKG